MPPTPHSPHPNAEGAAEAVLHQAALGFRSTLLSQVVRAGCKALSVVVIARLVAPAEHGLYAMAASVTTVLLLFRDLGIGPAAVQAPDLTEEQSTTLWRLHAGLGFLLTGAILALAPVAADFYAEPRLRLLLVVMSPAAALIGLGGWPRTLLQRHLQFAAVNRLEIVAALAGTGAMIAAGAASAGAYAFAVYLLVSEAVLCVGAWRLCAWRPRQPGRWGSLRGLYAIGGHLTGFNVLNQLVQQLDTVLTGRWFGAATLGLYSRSGQLLVLPALHVATPLAQVMIATLSRLGPSSRSFVHHLRDTVNLTAHLTLPFAAVSLVLPEALIRLALGPAWLHAVPLLRWLALNAAIGYLGTSTYGLCVAAGHTRRLTVMAALALPVTWLGLWLGRDHGAAGLAAGLTGVNLALFVPRLWWGWLGTPVRLRDYAAAMAWPLLTSACLAAGLAAGRTAAGGLGWLAQTGVALAGGACAVGLAAVLLPPLRHEFRHVWSRRPRRHDLDPTGAA